MVKGGGYGNTSQNECLLKDFYMANENYLFRLPWRTYLGQPVPLSV